MIIGTANMHETVLRIVAHNAVERQTNCEQRTGNAGNARTYRLQRDPTSKYSLSKFQLTSVAKKSHHIL